MIPAELARGKQGASAELTFMVGGRFGDVRWNDTNAAKGSVSATAVQFVHVVGVVILILSASWRMVDDMLRFP